jgi:hypothetical protein
VLLVLLVVVLLVGVVVQGASARQPNRSIDFAAVLPRPSDLDATGLTGFVSGVGATGGAATLDRFDALYRGGGSVPVPTRDGMGRGSVLVLVRESDLVSPSPDRVTGAVGQYRSAGEAGAAAQDLIDARAALDGAEVAPVSGSRTGDGDAPTIIMGSGNDPLGAQDYRQVTAVGVVGSVLVEVAVEFTSSFEPSIELAENLFSVVATRLTADPAGGTTPGNAIPDIVGDRLDPDVSRYVVADGETVPVAGRDGTAAEARTARFASYGAGEVVEFAYRSVDDPVSIGGYVSRHATANDADNYRADIPGILGTDETLADVRTSNEIVRTGDGGTLLTYTVAGEEEVLVTELVVQFDTYVVELIVSGADAVPASAMTVLAGSIQSCLEDGVCAPVVILDSLATPGV